MQWHVVRLICKLPAGARRRVLFAYFNHRLPNVTEPATFSDKVNWRPDASQLRELTATWVHRRRFSPA
jgi:hypothetical protein